ncbi:MAG: DUF4956 domain-containing protein [Treponema sp.]|jgi:uncharacterized membrane protein YhiD involved in acid resistance|nr:DUF4956 domain-containing protein [Treponema sp.]
MTERFFNGIDLTITGILVCSVTSLAAGVLTALTYTFRQTANKNFVITLAVLPVITQSIIMLVNGSMGTGIAVMGAFSLVRFRSVPGTAKEIACIFLAMALGLATGTGHIWYAVIFAFFINGMLVLYTLAAGFGEEKNPVRHLKIVIAENLDYTAVFSDVFSEYAKAAHQERVRTVNFGSLYEIDYTVILKDPKNEKEFLDKIRQRNSNLEISLGRPGMRGEYL